jgi:hydrogenase expression/formation protein HypC
MCLAVPGKVIEIYSANGARMGKVDFGGVVREACLDFLPEIEVGDYTIVHVGFGISRLDEEEARSTLELLKEIESLGEETPRDARDAPEAGVARSSPLTTRERLGSAERKRRPSG